MCWHSYLASGGNDSNDNVVTPPEIHWKWWPSRQHLCCTSRPNALYNHTFVVSCRRTFCFGTLRGTACMNFCCKWGRITQKLRSVAGKLASLFFCRICAVNTVWINWGHMPSQDRCYHCNFTDVAWKVNFANGVSFTSIQVIIVLSIAEQVRDSVYPFYAMISVHDWTVAGTTLSKRKRLFSHLTLL